MIPVRQCGDLGRLRGAVDQLRSQGPRWLGYAALMQLHRGHVHESTLSGASATHQTEWCRAQRSTQVESLPSGVLADRDHRAARFRPPASKRVPFCRHSWGRPGLSLVLPPRADRVLHPMCEHGRSCRLRYLLATVAQFTCSQESSGSPGRLTPPVLRAAPAIVCFGRVNAATNIDKSKRQHRCGSMHHRRKRW